MPAFQAAVAAGADVLELDVRLTNDGEIVVFHDDNGQRLAGKDTAIADCNFDEVVRWQLYDAQSQIGGVPSARVCRFEELLYTFPQVPLNVDLKDPGRTLVEAVRERVQAHAAWSRGEFRFRYPHQLSGSLQCFHPDST